MRSTLSVCVLLAVAVSLVAVEALDKPANAKKHHETHSVKKVHHEKEGKVAATHTTETAHAHAKTAKKVHAAVPKPEKAALQQEEEEAVPVVEENNNDAAEAEEVESNPLPDAVDQDDKEEEADLEEGRYHSPLYHPALPFTPFAHVPLIPATAHPLVVHVTGRKEEEPADPTEARSIILSPSYGPTSGGIWVQIVGAGSFHTPNSLQCKLDLVEQFCYSNHYYYSWCYITPKCAGVYPFHCHNGPMTFEGKYAVVAKTPWVTSVYPFSGDTSGGTPVTVRGWNFEPHCPQHLLCKFGEQIVPAKYYTSSSVMCIAPCSTEKGFVSVEVSNDGGMHWSMSGVQYGYVGDAVDLTAGECQRYLSPSTESNPHH